MAKLKLETFLYAYVKAIKASRRTKFISTIVNNSIRTSPKTMRLNEYSVLGCDTV